MASLEEKKSLTKNSLRLTQNVRPLHYALEVEVDPTCSSQYRGSVRIELALDTPQRAIELHARDLHVTEPKLQIGEKTLVGKITPQPRRETIRIAFSSVIAKGTAMLELHFTGKLRSDLRGLYAAASGQRKYAVTQLEATDARCFFPCFDEPDKKACLTLSVVTATKNSVIANAPIENTTPLSDGKKCVYFKTTPKISSYLYALAVGEFESSKPVKAGKTEIRIWYVPGKGALTKFGLEAARETLLRLEKYFDLAYPYTKLDLVAVPDFEFGAMENVGAVFFRETLLLCDPNTSTLSEKKRLAEVICHELAHMWYGNLVTMKWWDDLWLNEAFATWMAFYVVADWKPEWKMWNDFQHYRTAALDLDALSNTHAIYTKVSRPEEATQNFDLITYEKGASVLRMLEHYLGGEKFRRGIRAYICKHREGNTVAADLWAALSAASGEPVEKIAQAWITQEGFPLLRIRPLEKNGKSSLELRQERFCADTIRSTKIQKMRWPIPWVGKIYTNSRQSRDTKFLLTQARGTHENIGKASLLYGNSEEAGFFRPLHALENHRALIENFAALSTIERMGLLSHTWAQVRAGYVPLAAFLDLLPATRTEKDPDVLKTLRAPLMFLDEQVAAASGADIRHRFRNRLIEIFGEQLLELGWVSDTKESLDTKVRRSTIVAILGETLRWEACTRVAREQCEKYLDDHAVLEANLVDAVVHIAASTADAVLYAKLYENMQSARTPQERKRFLLALAAPQDAKLIAQTLRMALTDAVPTQDVAMLLVRLFQNEFAREATWKFIQARWPRVSKRLTPMMVARLIEATPALQTAAHQKEVTTFFKTHPAPTGERALRQALERFRLNTALRRRAVPQLRDWLVNRNGE